LKAAAAGPEAGEIHVIYTAEGLKGGKTGKTTLYGGGRAIPAGKREKGVCGGIVRFILILLWGRLREFVKQISGTGPVPAYINLAPLKGHKKTEAVLTVTPNRSKRFWFEILFPSSLLRLFRLRGKFSLRYSAPITQAAARAITKAIVQDYRQDYRPRLSSRLPSSIHPLEKRRAS
jgi:hypothetical protein